MTYHDLHFMDPVFHVGVNVTVRRGTKWLSRLFEGDVLNLKRASDESLIETGTVMWSFRATCESMPTWVYKYEHSTACRTEHDLIRELQSIYPGFKYDDLLTVIVFDVEEGSAARAA